jgi:hypothetical protein
MISKNEINSILVRCAMLIDDGLYLFKTTESEDANGIVSRAAYFVVMQDDISVSADEMVSINNKVRDNLIGVIKADKNNLMSIKLAFYSFDKNDPFSSFLNLRQHKIFNNAKKISRDMTYQDHESKLVTFEMIDHLVYCIGEGDGFKDIPLAKDLCATYNRNLPF